MRPGRLVLRGLAAALVLTAAAPAARAAAPPAAPVVPGLQQLRVAGAVDRGTIAPRTLDITVVLPLRDPAGARALAAALHRRGDPAYHRFLAAGEFAARFGAEPAAVAAVSDWARRSGLRVTSVSAARTLVRLSAPSPVVERALGMRLHAYQARGLDYVAPDGDARLPDSLAGRVRAVLGVGDLGRLEPTLRRPADPPPIPDGVLPPPPSLHLSHYGPADLWRFYDAPPAVRGAGQTVAVLAAGDVSHARSDLALFETRHGLPRVRWTTVPVGAPSTDLAGSPEWDLDTQVSTGMAPDVSDLLVYDTTSLSG